MKSAARGMTSGHERSYLRRGLVVMQIAVSLTLLVGALLFVRSFRNLVTFDPGMRESGITVAFLAFPRAHIAPDKYKDFQRQLLNDVQAIPGVLNAAGTTNLPLLGGSWEHGIRIGSVQGLSKFTWVSPDYFNTMGIRLIAGRNINQSDTSGSQRVAVVNQTFVRRYLSDTNPLGQMLRTDPEPGYPSTLYRIIGVIPDTKYNSLRSETPPMTFAPDSQFPDPWPFMPLVIHSNVSVTEVLSAVKRTITRKHPGVVVTGGDFQAWIRDGMVGERLMAMLAGLFGLIAALLAMVGLYGVIAYLVASRRPEIGIRVALGATRGQIIGMIMKEAWGLLLTGIVAGMILSLIAGRSASALLFDLKPYDPLTLVVATLGLTAISLIASFLPARRASTIDPTIALRYE
jgi:predicted permease